MDQTLARIGTLLDETQGRDAVHIAVAPVVAAEKLYPGQQVSLVPGSADQVRDAATAMDKALGIVDPFLSRPVFPDERFFVFLRPGSITSLRHEWTHPAFGAESVPVVDEPASARKWLADFAETLGLSYTALMDAAKKWLDYGEYTVQIDSENWRDEFYGHEEEFWIRYEIVTGQKVEEHDACFFSCSC